jgi:hypothetical protein
MKPRKIYTWVMWRIEVPKVTLSANQLNTMHWAERSRLKQAFGWLLLSRLNGIPKIPPPQGQRKVTIIRHGKRTLDKDNLYAGVKMLLDCIKEQRIIIDDKPKWLDLQVLQEPCGKHEPWTSIIIEDLDSPHEQT